MFRHEQCVRITILVTLMTYFDRHSYAITVDEV